MDEKIAVSGYQLSASVACGKVSLCFFGGSVFPSGVGMVVDASLAVVLLCGGGDVGYHLIVYASNKLDFGWAFAFLLTLVLSIWDSLAVHQYDRSSESTSSETTTKGEEKKDIDDMHAAIPSSLPSSLSNYTQNNHPLHTCLDCLFSTLRYSYPSSCYRHHHGPRSSPSLSRYITHQKGISTCYP